MAKKPTAAEFLQAMKLPEEPADAPRPSPAAKSNETAPTASKPAAKPKTRRAELKHFGGYLDDDTLEKIALLRVRLKKDNSELIKLAIEDLHRKHSAKRAFGDA